MKGFQDRVAAMIEEINSSPCLRINHLKFEYSEINKSDTEFIISEIEQLTNIKLSEHFKDYLFVTEEILISWDYNLGSGYERGGEFRLINLFDSLVRYKPKLWHNEMNNDEMEFLKNLYPFEDHPYSGDGKLVAFRILNSMSYPEIWLHDLRSGDYRLSLNYEEYIESLLETRAFFDWQYFFCDIKLDGVFFDSKKKALINMIDVMSRLFPDFKSQKYLEIFKRRWE